MKEITIPKKRQPIVQAFYAESEAIAKAYILQASRAVYCVEDESSEYSFKNKKHDLSNDELHGICALMQGLKPKDMLEVLLSAQIIVSHMLGMRKLAKGGCEEQRIGLKMLRFSNEVLCHLHKKRSGDIQNITANYNHGKVKPGHMLKINAQKEIEYAN